MSNEQITKDRQVSALKKSGVRYSVRVAGARGLWLRVSASGLKTFELQYTAPTGEHRRLRLGEYPHTGLADAVIKAGKARNEIVDGKDPASAKAAARAQARNGETLDEIFESYMAAAKVGLHGGRKKPKKPNTLKSERGLYYKHISPRLGTRKALEIAKPDIKKLMNTLASESGLRPASVAKVGEVLSAAFAYLVHIDRRPDNPVTGLAHPLAIGTGRERRFDDAGITALWKTLCIHSVATDDDAEREDETSRLAAETALALRFTMVTLCRRIEAAQARWSEIDRKSRLWEIPGSGTKNSKPRAVPLSDAALAILDAAAARADRSEEFIFPAPRDPKQHVKEERLTRAVSRLCVRLEIPPGSPHDFRRSGSSTLTGRYGFRRFDVGCVLGHTVRDGATVTAVYDRHDYLAEKRRALDAWARHVLDLAEGREPVPNVVELRPGAIA